MILITYEHVILYGFSHVSFFLSLAPFEEVAFQ